MARVFNHMNTHGVDFRLYFETGYELTGEFTQMIGSFIFGGFSGKEKKEIGRKGIVFGQEEWVFPDVDWENFRSPRGTHPPRKFLVF
jgi:hypothetical protein